MRPACRILALFLFALLAADAAACAAITQKGTVCKRAASPGSAYCWQHGGTTKAERDAAYVKAAKETAPEPVKEAPAADPAPARAARPTAPAARVVLPEMFDVNG
ncbi:MAG TPA: hypothetical protein VEK08_15080 [Planctomycetota bacterium]|nr:hypothetical protein [Planctomycetota bacterium]